MGTLAYGAFRNGKRLSRSRHQKNNITALALLSDTMLAAGELYGRIRLWDLLKSTEIVELPGHKSWIQRFIVLSDVSLASASNDGTIRIWDLRTYTERMCIEAGARSISDLAYLPDGRMASSSTGEPRIRIWDPEAGVQVMEIEVDLAIQRLTILPGGRIAGGAQRGSIGVWDYHTGIEVQRLECSDWLLSSLATLPNGLLVSGHYAANRVHLWDADRGTELVH